MKEQLWVYRNLIQIHYEWLARKAQASISDMLKAYPLSWDDHLVLGRSMLTIIYLEGM